MSSNTQEPTATGPVPSTVSITFTAAELQQATDDLREGLTQAGPDPYGFVDSALDALNGAQDGQPVELTLGQALRITDATYNLTLGGILMNPTQGSIAKAVLGAFTALEEQYGSDAFNAEGERQFAEAKAAASEVQETEVTA